MEWEASRRNQSTYARHSWTMRPGPLDPITHPASRHPRRPTGSDLSNRQLDSVNIDPVSVVSSSLDRLNLSHPMIVYCRSRTNRRPGNPFVRVSDYSNRYSFTHAHAYAHLPLSTGRSTRVYPHSSSSVTIGTSTRGTHCIPYPSMYICAICTTRNVTCALYTR
jgi:hypothetical protein